MGWTRRSARTGADPYLPMFDGEQAQRFVALAREVFAENGMETSYRSGCLHGSDAQMFGLTNVAHLAAGGKERHWRRVVEGHVIGLLAAHATPKERDLAVVRGRLFLRLWASADIPFGRGAALEYGDGLVGLASIDHPKHVETLTRAEDVEALGGWQTVARVAHANLARLRAEQTWREPAAQGHVFASLGGFFNASRVLAMPDLLKQDFLVEPPREGVLFAVPNRHLVVVHPLDGEGRESAAEAMAAIAGTEYEMAGGISPDLWRWQDGTVERYDH